MEYLRGNRTSLILYLLITVLVIALFLDSNPTFEKVELAVQDSMFRFRGTQPISNTVQICALDDPTLDKLGWPMKRESLARVIAGLQLSGASVVVCDFDWRNVAPPDSAGSDSILLATLSGNDRVVLPIQFTYADLGVSAQAPPREYRAATWTERFPAGAAVNAQALFGPRGFLADSAAALGSITPMLDRDRVIRWMPMLVDYGGYPFVSSVLWAASIHADVARTSWWLEPGEKIKVGTREIPIDERGRLLLNYYGPPRTFTYLSAREFLNVTEPNGRLAHKIVVLGPTGYQGGVSLKSRNSDDYPAVELTATAVENVVNGDFVTKPRYSALFDLLVLGLIGLFCAVVLPKISLMYRFVVLGISLFVLINLQYLLFASFGLLTHAFYVTVEIVFFMAVSPLIERKDEDEKLKKGSKAPQKLTPAYSEASHPATQPSYPGTDAEANFDASSGTMQVDGTSGTVRVVGASGTVRVPPAYPTSMHQEDSSSVPTTMMPSGTPPSGTVQTPTPSGGTPIPEYSEHSGPERVEPGAATESPTPGSTPPATAGSGPVQEPQFLGRYQVLEEIGRGAMGIVYKGVDPAINRPVALKTVRLDLAVPPAEKEELRGRLLREAQAAGQLSHPNIVTIYDVGSQGDIHYIAMEYLRGYTLERAVVKKMSLNYKIFAKLMIQVCDALEYAHSNELVHRDIKPANIMVLDNFRVKVMDFGIARVAHSNMTQTGIALGTPSYISPEQLAGHGVDRRSDVFSLGVVMYEILSKEKPFTGDTINKLIFNILNEKPRRLTDIDKNIPDVFNQICMKALEKDPTKRYQYASDLSRDLKEFVSSLAPQRLIL